MNEIISIAEMGAIDAASAHAGVASETLMDNAGTAVAAAIVARFSPRPTAVLCGPGNNGGDGWVAARVLQERGWPVRVETLAPLEALKGDAARAARGWTGATRAIDDSTPNAALFVDALFGAGLRRPLKGHAARLAQTLSGASERVVAVDVPSGLDADAAKPLGQACFRAGLTVTFVRKKRCHLLFPGRAFCGEILAVDIGAPEETVAALGVRLWENGPSLWQAAFPWPGADAHKHARGQVMVASGGHARTGAARLAARAALRIGAGLVTVLSPSEAMAENAAQLTAIMLREAIGGAYAQAAQDVQAFVIGPAFGVGPAERSRLDEVLAVSPRAALVLDADAITLLAPQPHRLDPRDVMTPHVGEFKRAFGDLLERSPSRIEAAIEAARRTNCVVLLKGPDTVVAAPDGRAVINSSGAPFLATAGSGDVLAGFISGLIAQGMASFEAAAAGAWLHGKAGEALGAGLIAEDLPEILPTLLNGLAPPELWKRRLD